MLRVPPVTVTSPPAKVVLASLRVKVMVSGPVMLPLPERVTAMVGGVVSAGKVLVPSVRVLLASAPSWLKLLAASLNLLEATLMTLAPRLLMVGVKTAV